MKEGDRRYLRSARMDNIKRLRNLGLLTDLFSEGFWEREAKAKEREAGLFLMFEAAWRSGHWNHLSLPLTQIIEHWRAESNTRCTSQALARTQDRF